MVSMHESEHSRDGLLRWSGHVDLCSRSDRSMGEDIINWSSKVTAFYSHAEIFRQELEKSVVKY